MAVLYTQALLDRATAYVGQPLTAKRQDTGLTQLSQLYAAITGQPVGKCRQCQYSDYLAVVTAYISHATRFLHPELMADSKYTFAPGFQNETLVHPDYNQAVTADNLTDEAAKFFLKHGFGHVIIKKDGQPGDAAPEAAASTTEVVPDKPLVPQADLEKEQAAHTATRQKAQDAATKAGDALKAEKAAHGETKKQLTATTKERDGLQKQVTELQTQLTDAQAALAKYTNGPAEKTE